MFKLISFIFTGCWHKWEIIQYSTLTGDGARGTRVTYKCSRCLKHKKQDLI